MPLAAKIAEKKSIVGQDGETSAPEDGDNARDNGTETVYDVAKLCQSLKTVNPTHFTIIRVLGQGSFGKVYLVKKNTEPDLDNLFAMKVLRKASLKVRDRIRTKLERDILAAIRHPFIVKLLYAFQTEGKLYLILEYLRGGDLFARLSKEFMFTEEDVKFYLAELALALSHLHGLGIIYRDLKPENILLDREGHIKLTDFGLSKESIYDEERANAFSFCGTIEYMAPEVVNRKGHGPAADWWSFGVLMFEMLTGDLPFSTTNRQETLKMILQAKLAMPDFLSKNAQHLLRSLLRRKRCNRLGYGPSGISDIKVHPFFEGISWEDLFELKIAPPFKPVCSPLSDVFYFNSDFSILSALDIAGIATSKSTQELFKGFSFNASEDDSRKASANGDKHVDSEKVKEDRSALLQKWIPFKNTSFEDDYSLGDILTSGSYYIIYECYRKANNQKYSVKIVNRSLKNSNNEAEILVQFSSHPNIITLFDVYETNTHAYLVTEYVKGDNLLEYVQNHGSLDEESCRKVVTIVARVLSYLHGNQVVHRDLKPTGLVYGDSGRSETLRLCDFGFARQLKAENGMLMTPCYTANFVAPEVLKQQGYDASCDIWNFGIIFLTILCGSFPFSQDLPASPSYILEQVENGFKDCDHEFWQDLLCGPKDLLRRMLCIDPKKRITANEILLHSWIRRISVVDDVDLITHLPADRNTLSEVRTNNDSERAECHALGSVSSSTIAMRRQQRSQNRLITELSENARKLAVTDAKSSGYANTNA